MPEDFFGGRGTVTEMRCWPGRTRCVRRYSGSPGPASIAAAYAGLYQVVHGDFGGTGTMIRGRAPQSPRAKARG